MRCFLCGKSVTNITNLTRHFMRATDQEHINWIELQGLSYLELLGVGEKGNWKPLTDKLKEAIDKGESYTEAMANFDKLVKDLANIRVTDNNRNLAETVANSLIKAAFKEEVHSLSERERDTITRNSRDRLWNSYMNNRKNKEMESKEAAEVAIANEIEFLKRWLAKIPRVRTGS